jgi:hypothetical protein
MADGITIDTSDAKRFTAELGRIVPRAVPRVEAVLKKGAENLKKDMAAAFEERPHFKRIGAAVSYERRGFASEIAYEVGPEIGRGAGSLAGIAVDGGANGGGGSVKVDHLLEPEAAAIEKHLSKILDDLL